jgi:uncharacterized protein YukE
MRLPLALAALAALLPLATAAAPYRPNPDWPCQQPLVPTVTAAMIWQGPPLDANGDWHDDAAVAALVARVAPRHVAIADGTAAIADYVKGLDGAERPRRIGLAFAGLLDESNRERAQVIDGIKELAARQRNLAELIAKLTSELDATPATATGEAAAKRDELYQRWSFNTQTYNSVEQTMRYACEIPGKLDARLGAYARALEAGLR